MAAVVCGLSRTLLNVFVLVPVKIFRVEEALTADQALVRALSGLEVRFTMATGTPSAFEREGLMLPEPIEVGGPLLRQAG